MCQQFVATICGNNLVTICDNNAGLYFVTFMGKEMASVGRWWGISLLVVFLLVNIIIGLWGISLAFFSQPEPNGGLYAVYVIVYLATLALIALQMYWIVQRVHHTKQEVDDVSADVAGAVETPGHKQGDPEKALDRISRRLNNIVQRLKTTVIQVAFAEENVYVTLRMLFWAQYLFSIPAMVFLYDGLHHTSRIQVNAISRLLFVLGIGFSAIGFDICLAIHEKLQLEIYGMHESLSDPMLLAPLAPNGPQVDSMNAKEDNNIPYNTPLQRSILLTICTGDNAR